LSLADRFGITLTFTAPNQAEYLTIVTELAKQRGIPLPQTELEARANQWALQHNGRSGRTAKQFIDQLQGELKVKGVRLM
jgi:predicted AAA+ superfamily ATPase